MSTAGQRDDIMLKLVHTADWHLGRQFRSFPEDGALKLSRARLEVIDRILLTADRYAVDAVLCAGDLFDEPNPLPDSPPSQMPWRTAGFSATGQP
jgi:metallophosphoesterase superfamily enzyme